MLTRILGSRGLMSATVVLVLVLAGALGITLSKPSPPMREYCAEMPDSIGLYKDSAVTIMGVSVGRVTGIQPNGATAHVTFTVPAARKLPLDVGAVTVSNTLISDRELDLVGAEPAGPGWNPATCITRTLTPKSLTQTFDALTRLSDELDGARDADQHNAIGDGLDALDTATAGSADQLNTLVLRLSRALAAPDAAIGHIGDLLDALADLAHRARNSWPSIEASVTGLTQTFHDIDAIAFPPIIELVANLHLVLPQLNDVLMMFGSPALRTLDADRDLPRLIVAGVGSLTDLLRMTPVIADGFEQSVDPATGQFTIRYAAPRLAVSPQNTTAVCAAVRTLTGHDCSHLPGGAVTVPTLPQLLQAVTGR